MNKTFGAWIPVNVYFSWYFSKPHDELAKMLSWRYEPGHEISDNVVYATSKGSDQPAHTHSMIRAFANRLNILRIFRR